MNGREHLGEGSRRQSWVAIIGAAVWFLGRSRSSSRPSRARELLDERYARGELSTEEYRERIDHLG